MHLSRVLVPGLLLLPPPLHGFPLYPVTEYPSSSLCWVTSEQQSRYCSLSRAASGQHSEALLASGRQSSLSKVELLRLCTCGSVWPCPREWLLQGSSWKLHSPSPTDQTPLLPQVLWPYLFEFLTPVRFTAALTPLCRSLVHLALKRQEAGADTFLVQYDAYAHGSQGFGACLTSAPTLALCP